MVSPTVAHHRAGGLSPDYFTIPAHKRKKLSVAILKLFLG